MSLSLLLVFSQSFFLVCIATSGIISIDCISAAVVYQSLSCLYHYSRIFPIPFFVVYILPLYFHFIFYQYKLLIITPNISPHLFITYQFAPISQILVGSISLIIFIFCNHHLKYFASINFSSVYLLSFISLVTNSLYNSLSYPSRNLFDLTLRFENHISL